VDPAENRRALQEMPELGGSSADEPLLVVLPEAAACDFGPPGTDISSFAESTTDGPFVSTVTDLSTRSGATVVAGMFETSQDASRPYNTLVVVDRDGPRATYRKIHLYDSFGYKESERLLPGDVEPVTVDVHGVTVGLMTCYDLRFPELARALVDRGAELLVVPSAWVAGPAKLDHWRTLLRARAIENTVYVAAAAQPGPRYTGHSLVVDPMGEVLAEAGDDQEILTVELDTTVIAAARERNPSLANRRL
jgi:predicted amidohydrolase